MRANLKIFMVLTMFLFVYSLPQSGQHSTDNNTSVVTSSTTIEPFIPIRQNDFTSRSGVEIVIGAVRDILSFAGNATYKFGVNFKESFRAGYTHSKSRNL